ncbi:hypothetical protein BDV97DRAFT_365859 [Delphinella strobiligena]|nr:hypothetical protein BDV97DRAFT_365859 [Delphinella strobiligena]
MESTAERDFTGGLPQSTPQSPWVPEPSTFVPVAQAGANSSDDSVFSRPTGTHRSVFRQVRLAVRRYGSTPEISYWGTPGTSAIKGLATKSPERPSLKTRFSSFDLASGFRELERKVSDVSHVLGVHQFHLVKPHTATVIPPSTNTPRVSEQRLSAVRYGSEDHVRTAIPPISAYLSLDMKNMHTTLPGEFHDDHAHKHKDSVIILLEQPSVSDNDVTKDDDTIYATTSPSYSSSPTNPDLPITSSFGADDTFSSLDVTPNATPRPSLELHKHHHLENIRIIPHDETSISEPQPKEISFDIPDYGLDDYEYHFDHDEAYDQGDKVDIEIAFDIPDHQPDSPVCPINMVGHLRSKCDKTGRIKVRRCPLHSSDEFCIKGSLVRKGHRTRIVWSQQKGSLI